MRGFPRCVGVRFNCENYSMAGFAVTTDDLYTRVYILWQFGIIANIVGFARNPAVCGMRRLMPRAARKNRPDPARGGWPAVKVLCGFGEEASRLSAGCRHLYGS